MNPHYQMPQRHPQNSSEPGRHQYIPPPPPPTTTTTTAPPNQNLGIPLPPPPPRPPPNQAHGMMMPPPPGASSHGQYGWQTNWARQPYAQQQYNSGQHATYNPNAYHSYHHVSTAQPQVHSQSQDNQPLTSATYIPFGESFGPGVGIPPLHPGQMQFQQRASTDSQSSFYNGESLEYQNGGDTLRSIQGSGQTPEMNVQLLREVNTLTDNESSRYYAQKSAANDSGAQYSASTVSPPSNAHRQSDGNSSNTPVTPQDSGLQWPLDRVLAWLASHSFSADWQETFKTLDLHGAKFLELGRGHGGRGNVGQMHSVVYPQLAKECFQSGSGWDQAREREEGKRLRKLIRSIVDISPSSNTKHGANQRSSGAGATGDNISEQSRHDGHSSTPTTAGGGDDSPGQQMAFNAAKGASTMPLSQRRFSPQKDSNHGNSVTSAEANVTDASSRSIFSEAILKGVGDDVSSRRHSPSGSREAVSSSTLSVRDRADSSRLSYENSPQLSPAISHPRLPSSATNGAQSSTSHGRYYGHKRGVSSDSSHGGLLHDTKKHGQESARTTPIEAGGRPSSNELPTSAKEHKGFLNKFMRRSQKKDDMHPSPEELQLESPTSPVAFRQYPIHAPYGKASINSSETSLDRPPSRTTPSEIEKSSRTTSRTRHTSADIPKKFIMVTPDKWNYRLVDVSEVHSAEVLRSLVCYNLGITDSRDLSIFLTLPGQYEHLESLSDTQIMQALQRADSGANVKIYIKSPFPISQQSATSFSGNSVEVTSPAADSSTLERLDGIEQSSNSQEAVLALAEGGNERREELDHEQTTVSRKTSLQIAAQEHRREIERKQKAYLTERKNRLRNPSPADGSPTSGTFKRDGVIDFDAPRDSPFEEKKVDSLVPRRKPPPVPAVSNTLIKANSLSKRPDAQTRHSWSDRHDHHSKRASDDLNPRNGVDRGRKTALIHSSSTSSGVAGAIVGVGRLSSAVGAPPAPAAALVPTLNKPSPTHYPDESQQEPSRRAMQNALQIRTSSPSGSPGSPGFTMSKGNVPFKIPAYDTNPPEDEAPSREASEAPGLTNPIIFKVKETDQSDSPDTSPSTVKPPRLPSRMPTRRSNGPTFEFKETPISFDKSPAKALHVSSDDSDDGLFAIPLKSANKSKTGSSPMDTHVSQDDTSPERGMSRSERPSLTLKTSRSRKGMSVAFQSPQFAPSPQYSAVEQSSALSASDFTLDRESSADKPFPESAASTSWSAESPNEATKAFRRQSFASDVWASRPPTEALVENLDEFFPNVDLDQPVVEDQSSSPTSSPGPSKGVKPSRKESVESMRSDVEIPITETLVSKRNDRVHNLSRRSVGLGRTKSIREVVKGAYQHPDKLHVPGIARVNTLKAAAISRRKSTKMFGAKIEQIKPPRGSRRINLETIAQDTLTNIPQRQPTFKWVKGQLIGKGTFGRVYLGMNTTTGELLAVKQVEVTPKLAGQDKDKMKEMVKALDQEIDTMQHLDHVNIVQYLGCERKEYSISIFLEYIPGGSVGSCLRKHGKFEEPVVSSLTRQTLSGLAYLHHEGILHRDLKADNILLDNDGTCKISDFGISKKTDNIYGNDVTNSMQGSVFWMAPEVIRSQDLGYSAKVDIWSLGCVVLEMFAGRRPWSKEEAIGAIYKLGSLNQAPPIPDDVASTISPAALSFMYDCFNVDPADRPTAETLLRAPFCFTDPHFNFLDTELYAKIRPNFEPEVAKH